MTMASSSSSSSDWRWLALVRRPSTPYPLATNREMLSTVRPSARPSVSSMRTPSDKRESISSSTLLALSTRSFISSTAAAAAVTMMKVRTTIQTFSLLHWLKQTQKLKQSDVIRCPFIDHLYFALTMMKQSHNNNNNNLLAPRHLPNSCLLGSAVHCSEASVIILREGERVANDDGC